MSTSIVIQLRDKTRIRVIRKPIAISDREWFIKEHRKSFTLLHANNNKILHIEHNDTEILVERNRTSSENFFKMAIIDFDDYVANPKQGYKAIAGWHDNRPIAVLLYREMNEEQGSIYYASGFFNEDFKDIGKNLLLDLMKSLRNKIDLITRHALLSMCNRLKKIENTLNTCEKKYLSTLDTADTVEKIDLKRVTLEEPITDDVNKKNWLIEQLKCSFKYLYSIKTFWVETKSMPVLLSPQDQNKKTEWIQNTVKLLLEVFLENPKKGNKVLFINYKNKNIGCLMYAIIKEKIMKIVYLFIVPECQRKGIGMHIIKSLLKNLYKKLTTMNVSVQPHNEIALEFFKKAGFKQNKTESLSIYRLNLQKNFEPIKEKSLSTFPIKPKSIFIWSSVASLVLVGCIGFRERGLKAVLKL